MELVNCLVDTSDTRRWLDARDLFLGQNFKEVRHNKIELVRKALEMAATCEHPDAKWLSSVDEKYGIRHLDLIIDRERNDNALMQAIKGIFIGEVDYSSQHLDTDVGKENYARSLCFAAMIIRDDLHPGWEDGDDYIRIRYDKAVSMLRESAELGYAFAQGALSGLAPATDDEYLVSEHVRNTERLKWAKLAADQNDRAGLYYLASIGYEKNRQQLIADDSDMALKLYKRSADLGYDYAMEKYVELLGRDNAEYYLWQARIITNGDSSGGYFHAFISGICHTLKRYSISPTNMKGQVGAVIFQIGKCLIDGNFNAEKLECFGHSLKNWVVWSNWTGVTWGTKSISMHNIWCRMTADAIYHWILIAKRNRIDKDCIRVISDIVWKSRKHALYILEAPV